MLANPSQIQTSPGAGLHPGFSGDDCLASRYALTATQCRSRRMRNELTRERGRGDRGAGDLKPMANRTADYLPGKHRR